jgi:TolA-binding protein
MSIQVARMGWILLLLGAVSGCASAPATSASPAAQPAAPPKADEADAMRAQLTELRTMMTNLGTRIDSMETRLGSLGDKVTNNQSSLDMLMANTKAVPSAVGSHPSEGGGSSPSAEQAPNDPEAGFASDEAIQAYRKASILLAAQKYPEAVLAYSSFVEKYPDHPLAGSAQFYVGDAYFREKEYKLALGEFERVLTSYDRSPHVADTLREMAEAEDHLKMTEQAARHRQLLTSLFPQSPAASPAVSDHSQSTEAKTTSRTAPSAALDAPPATTSAAPSTGSAAPSAPAAPAASEHGTPPTAPMSSASTEHVPEEK